VDSLAIKSEQQRDADRVFQIVDHGAGECARHSQPLRAHGLAHKVRIRASDPLRYGTKEIDVHPARRQFENPLKSFFLDRSDQGGLDGSGGSRARFARQK
jgi:hypothetical protein